MKRVLIVDDERNIRRLYEREFREEGYDVDVAGDGFEAIRLAEERRPDCVIMDIRMQEMDGLEAMTRILDGDRTIPVVINSAYSGPKSNFLSWCAHSYVVKSSDIEELKLAVANAIAVGSAQGPPQPGAK